ncbi:unnamed protein product [Effrenium voratum]|nr:unnamed protein product [Effrenium voratum]
MAGSQAGAGCQRARFACDAVWRAEASLALGREAVPKPPGPKSSERHRPANALPALPRGDGQPVLRLQDAHPLRRLEEEHREMPRSRLLVAPKSGSDGEAMFLAEPEFDPDALWAK